VLPPDPGALGFFRHLSDPHFSPVRVTAATLRRQEWATATPMATATAEPEEPIVTHPARRPDHHHDNVEAEVEGFVFNLDQYVQEAKRLSDQMQLIGRILDDQRAATTTLVRNAS
jgi:hypothetical protein